MSIKVVAASGYFDPIHYGHVEYLQKAKDLGDRLIVIVNNDRQASLKKGKSFMPAAERVKLVRSLACVDAAIEAMDEDRTVCKTLAAIHPDIFAKGGDQFVDTIPEAETCRKLGIEMRDGLGAKIQSSSWLIEGAAKLTEDKKKNDGPKTAKEDAAKPAEEDAKETSPLPKEAAKDAPPRKQSDAEGGGGVKKKKSAKTK